MPVVEVAHPRRRGAPRCGARGTTRACLGVRDDLERGERTGGGRHERRPGAGGAGGGSVLDRGSRNGTFSILLPTGRVRRVDRRGLLGGGGAGPRAARARRRGAGASAGAGAGSSCSTVASPSGPAQQLARTSTGETKQDLKITGRPTTRRRRRMGTGAGRRAAAVGRPAVFSVTLRQRLALQVLKDAQSLPSVGAATAWRWAPTALLALSVARVHAAPRSTDALVALAMNGIIVLACNDRRATTCSSSWRCARRCCSARRR